MVSNENSTMSWFETTSIITASFLGILISMVKVFRKKKDTYKENIEFIQVHSQIHETLTELRIETDSDRAQVMQFHNGEYFMDGVSMRKFSLSHESISRGVSADFSRMKALPCSMFVPLLNFVLRDYPTIISVNKIPYSFCKQFFEDNNVGYISVSPLRVRGAVTGFILNQWSSNSNLDNIDVIDSKKFMEYMEDSRNAIEVQLAQQKKG